MFTKKLRFLTLLALILASISSIALAAPMTSNNLTMPMAYSTGAFGSNEVLPGKSPTTGLDFTGEYKPLVVQIENDPVARPILNMSEADIVYEGIYWGPAYTRYTLIFNDNHPDYVGSIRSTRLHHCVIRQEWDAPFVFWGGQFVKGIASDCIAYFKDQKVDKQFLISGAAVSDASREDWAVGRTSGADILNRMGVWKREGADGKVISRANPHDAVANLEKIVSDYWPKNEDDTPYKPRSHAFRFSTTPTQGQDTAKAIDIKYDTAGKYAPSYTFNSTDRVYERWYDGKEQYDGITGKRIVASNVIVQYVEITYVNNNASRPVVQMMGNGPIDAFIDGQHIRGTWTHSGANTRTIFADASGNELTLLPGKTFIQLIPWNSSFTYTDASGAEHVMDSGSKMIEQKLEEGNMDEMNKMGE